MGRQVAVLIDGDNISAKYARYIKQEAMQYGNIQICRMYGSVSSPSVKSWYKVMPEQGIMPVLQISYANGKSVADQALTIDAMDLLYTGDIDVFCLVSSDSDFTKLAYRLKEFGKKVIGMGEQKTKEALAKACDEFKILDLIYKSDVETDARTQDSREAEVEPLRIEPSIPESMGVLVAAADPVEEEQEQMAETETEISIPSEEDIVSEISSLLDDDEWSSLASIGNLLSQRRPGFDARNYSYRNMSAFIKSHADRFEMKRERAQNNANDIIYIRKKNKKNVNRSGRRKEEPEG
ncbi:MAG: NYN domain-containing protein [Lachnospiraceae bacterium]|nr:NYN domain-containing protein [Lachnospiraceae bacterium]